jgi:RND family efflux transporter MFP subunit
MVGPSMSIAKISSTSELEVDINVAERFVSRISVGQIAQLTFDAFPGEVFTARVAEVNPVLDTSSRSMGVKLVLDPPDSRIKIGMYCRVKLITESKTDVVSIPRAAIVTKGGQNSVFVVNGSTVENRPISVGITVDNMVEITSGLMAGNEVVISGQTLLESGSKVNVVSRQEGK